MGRKPSIPSLDLKELSETLGGLLEETDRALALIGGAFVADAVKRLFEKRLKGDKDTRERVFQMSGPLGTWGSQSNLAFCLGWFGAKAKADMDRIRDIRNEFAHVRLNYTFKTPHIAASCGKLNFRLLAKNDRLAPLVPARVNYGIACGFLSTCLLHALDVPTPDLVLSDEILEPVFEEIHAVTMQEVKKQLSRSISKKLLQELLDSQEPTSH